MKYKLCNGLCCKRFVCINIDTKVCVVSPDKANKFVECKHFENKFEDDEE